MQNYSSCSYLKGLTKKKNINIFTMIYQRGVYYCQFCMFVYKRAHTRTLTHITIYTDINKEFACYEIDDTDDDDDDDDDTHIVSPSLSGTYKYIHSLSF